jgi:hypothetical protein
MVRTLTHTAILTTVAFFGVAAGEDTAILITAITIVALKVAAVDSAAMISTVAADFMAVAADFMAVAAVTAADIDNSHASVIPLLLQDSSHPKRSG